MANSGLRFHESPLFFCLYPGECDKKCQLCGGKCKRIRQSAQKYKLNICYNVD